MTHAFGMMSYPLPDDHWLYAERQYEDGADEPNELGKPILTHALRDAVVSAVRYAIRGATNCGKELDFDPDALVQNAVYALCGPYTTNDTSQKHVDEIQKQRHEQERPAPCARHCEATAFQITIKNLEAQLAQPEQEPVALPLVQFEKVAEGIEVGYDVFGGVDIRLGGEFVYVHINYDYRYTHNAERKALAKQIVGLLTTPPQRKPLLDDEIEAVFMKCGGKWDGDKWVIEDADLHPFARTIESPDLNTLIAISDEYNAWIKHHAAGHTYDDFLAKREAAHGIKE